MPKISIQQKPTFKQDVEIPQVGGPAVKVPFTFNFLTRDQIAEFVDDEMNHGKELAEFIRDGEATVKDLTARSVEFQVKQLKQIIAGWGFDDELNDENIRALVCSAANVPDTIVAAYKGAYQGARQGN